MNMTKRKGELSSARIDSDWPHQVVLADEEDHKARYERHKAMDEFCTANSISRAPRGHSFAAGDTWHYVHCLATREQAELFKERFGGEFFDPRERGRGSCWAQRRGGK